MKYENVEATMADAIVNFPPPISLAIGDKRAVFVFPNGMAMVFDADGNQVPQYQGSAAHVIAELIALGDAAREASDAMQEWREAMRDWRESANLPERSEGES